MAGEKPIPMSAEGHAALEAELQQLVEVDRPAIVRRVATTREEGDLKENFGYHDARRELGMLDGRVQTIKGTLRNAVVVDSPVAGAGIGMGSVVVVSDEFGETTYTVVGPAEADISNNRISVESPLGAALQGRSVGEEATFETPGGERTVTVVRIE